MSAVWEAAGLPHSRYLTPHIDDEVVFVLASAGNNGSLALDNIAVSFCLPCNFATLRSVNVFELSYANYSRIYLRTAQTISIMVRSLSVLQDSVVISLAPRP